MESNHSRSKTSDIYFVKFIINSLKFKNSFILHYIFRLIIKWKNLKNTIHMK